MRARGEAAAADGAAPGAWGRARQEIPHVWAVSWPVTISALVQIMLPVVDTVLLGRVSLTALATLGVAAPVYVLATVILNGAGLGIKVMVARRHGAGESLEVGKVTRVSLALTTGLGTVLAVLVLAVAAPLSAVLAPSAAVAGGAIDYLYISAVSIPGLAASVTLVSAYAGVGRTRVMLSHALLLGTVNLAVGVALVFGAGLGVRGAALATVLAVYVGLAFLVLYGRARMRALVPFDTRALTRADWRTITAKLWRIGWPEMVLLGVGFMSPVVLVGMLSSQGETAVASFRVLDNVFMLLMAIVAGFHSGVTILSGQCLGAADTQRVDAVQRAALLLCGAAVVLVTAPLLLAPAQVVAAIAPDEAITAAILPALPLMALAFLAIGAGAVVSGLLRAAGDARSIMATELLGEYAVVLPLTWLLVIRGGLGLEGLGLAWVAGWWLILMLKVLRSRSGFWRSAEV